MLLMLLMVLVLVSTKKVLTNMSWGLTWHLMNHGS